MRNLARKVTSLLKPVWETAFRDPVRESHIRLAGMGTSERQLAIVGLITLALLLGSVLFADLWRGGELLPIGDFGGDHTFLPVGMLPVTLIAFMTAWALLLWGALTASPIVRLAVAVTFLLTNASLGVAVSVSVGERAALDLGPMLIRIGYFLPAAMLLLSIPAAMVPRIARIARPLLRIAIIVGLGMFFLGHLWIHIVYVEEGFQGGAQSLMSGAITEIEGLLLPLVYVSGILVIDFSLDVAEGVALAARTATRTVARWLLAGFISRETVDTTRCSRR